MSLPGGSPSKYLERHIFPVLLPGIEETLQVAKRTERRKHFNSLDYLSAYLYRHNPRHSEHKEIAFEEIPFVKEEWAKNPRPSLPLSATLTEDEAATIIQAYYRGYLARRGSNVQLFREWQRKVREERKAAVEIQGFWRSIITKKHAVQQPVLDSTKEERTLQQVVVMDNSISGR